MNGKYVSGAKWANVFEADCSNNPASSWNWWENGEITNEDTNLCISVCGYYGKDNIVIYYCDSNTDQLWYQSHTLEDKNNKKFNAFINKKSNWCMDTDSLTKPNMFTRPCTSGALQSFKWTPKEWT